MTTLKGRCGRCGKAADKMMQYQIKEPLKLGALSIIPKEFKSAETTFLCDSCIREFKRWIKRTGNETI